MNKDGSFPFEAERGAKALMYTGRTIMGLIKAAHMAELQGIDLWSRTYKKDGQKISKSPIKPEDLIDKVNRIVAVNN